MGLTVKLEWGMHVRSFPGAPRGGDAGVVREFEGGTLLALIDATGHGLTAYSVAQVARRFLLNTHLREPDEILRELDEVLKGGIGAAISVARIQGQELVFAGVGNVSGSVDRRPLLVRTGVVGHRMRTPVVERVPFGPDSWFLMHTDGVSRPRDIPGGSADTVARALVESEGSLHDDAGVLFARWREEPA